MKDTLPYAHIPYYGEEESKEIHKPVDNNK
jgi:hypothetical protein